MKDEHLPDKLMVIGGSAGSLAMVLKILPLLRRDMNLCIVIVFHRKESESGLIELLSQKTALEVKEGDDKETLQVNTIYIAPPDYHLLVEKDKTLSLDDSEKVNFSRPSIDVTFESAADVFNSSLTCVLLSGANADGVDGLEYAKSTGSTIVVQDPASAEVSFMPQQAIKRLKPDFIINNNNIQDFLDNQV